VKELHSTIKVLPGAPPKLVLMLFDLLASAQTPDLPDFEFLDNM